MAACNTAECCGSPQQAFLENQVTHTENQFCHIHDEDKPERLKLRRDDLQKYKIFAPLLRHFRSSCANDGKEANPRIVNRLHALAEEEKDKIDFYPDLCVLKTENNKQTKPTLIANVDLSGDDPILGALDQSSRISVDDVPSLLAAIATQPGIVSIDLRYNRLQDAGASLIAEFLKTTPTLRQLNIMNNKIGEEGGIAIASAIISPLCYLLRLRINGNPLGDAAGQAFATSLRHVPPPRHRNTNTPNIDLVEDPNIHNCSDLNDLDLNKNPTLEKIIDRRRQPRQSVRPRLIALDLGDCQLKTDATLALAVAIGDNQILKALNLKNPRLFSLGEETTIHIAKGLRVNSCLVEIHLREHNMTDFGADWLADNLRHNQTLKLLDLSRNLISERGCHSLSLHLLQHDTPLEILDLSVNRIDDDGAFHLANALLKNTKLKTLGLASNKISTAGFLSLVTALKRNTTLTSLYVFGNPVTPEAAEALNQLVHCKRLVEANIDFRPNVVDGVTRLTQVTRGVNIDYYWTPYYGDRSLRVAKTRTIEGGVQVPNEYAK